MNFSPEIGYPGGVKGQRIIRKRLQSESRARRRRYATHAAELAQRRPRIGDGRIGAERRVVLRASLPHERSRGQEIRGRRGDILIRDIHLLFKRIELRIVEYLPPIAFERGVAGLGLLPSIRILEVFRRQLLVCGRRGGRGPNVFRPYRATGEKRNQKSQEYSRASTVKADPSPALHGAQGRAMYSRSLVMTAGSAGPRCGWVISHARRSSRGRALAGARARVFGWSGKNWCDPAPFPGTLRERDKSPE